MIKEHEEEIDDFEGYEPDKKIDRYHSLKDVMFDERTIKNICKTLRGGKRILYKDLQIGKVHHDKRIITHKGIEYSMLDVGDLTLFEFVNNLPGLDDIPPENILRLDKEYYKKQKNMERDKRQENILEYVNMSLFFEQIRKQFKPGTLIFSNGNGVVIRLLEDGLFEVDVYGRIIIEDGKPFDKILFSKIINYIFTSEHYGI